MDPSLLWSDVHLLPVVLIRLCVREECFLMQTNSGMRQSGPANISVLMWLCARKVRWEAAAWEEDRWRACCKLLMLGLWEFIDRNDPKAILGSKDAIRFVRDENNSSSEETRSPGLWLISERYEALHNPSWSGHNTSFSLISLKGENMIPPIDCCINVLPSDERWGVLCFYVIRLTPSWEWAFCSAPVLLQCQGACDGHLEGLVLLCVLFVLSYHPRHFTNQGIILPATEDGFISSSLRWI